MITAVTSWRGVGTSTTALLLATALAATDDAWLIEADPAGGVLAGRISLAPHEIGGLEHLSFGSGSGPAPERFSAVAHQQGTLRIVAAPADPFRAHACHSPRTRWCDELRELEGDVVVDVGRVRSGSPIWPLLEQADAVVLSLSPEVSAAVASSEWLRAGGRVAPGDVGLGKVPVRVAVVDVPGGVAFPEAAVRADFGDHWGAWLEWEPITVDLVHRGATADDRRLRRSALMASVRRLAAAVRDAIAVTR